MKQLILVMLMAGLASSTGCTGNPIPYPGYEENARTLYYYEMSQEHDEHCFIRSSKKHPELNGLYCITYEGEVQ